MIVIQICVGSSCHMKGSYHIIKTYKQLIDKYNLSNEIELKASFCMQRCTGGIAATIDNEPVLDLTVQTCEQIFGERVLKRYGHYSA